MAYYDYNFEKMVFYHVTITHTNLQDDWGHLFNKCLIISEVLLLLCECAAAILCSA